MAAEDDAERVADRVGKDSEAGLTLTGCTGGTKGEQFLLGLFGISHANVEMHLTVELRQRARVGTVDHCFLEAPDHTESMSARRG